MAFFSKTLDKLKGALRKTAEVLNTDVRTLFIPGRQINDEFLTVVEEKLLRPGTPRRNWKHTLLSDGHVIVRHPDWDEAHRMSFAAATGIRMYAEPAGQGS